ncbi:hypothetical protein Palpr_1802 [Paludibacter propionicigenes WB4]|jgi:hypothetical protein|uniref:DUF4252 domain-containing protein n=1 Tax=Paludibacter propionicigenes (strain DSM 17365 / JCM 13257 / WB4) TaxID=694427 RepID=E4T5E7_PALPW|nr:DUF6108 family protein [Paludibacter propionicigenes]ADQ79941.1 hypothetical protein Palpr_1802 [Paludibacter propionicigenes WB4]
MKSIKMHFVPILILLLTISPSLLAQKDLQISKVFDQYGEKKGVVMVDLTNEMLDGYDFSSFKSITIKNNPSAADFIRKCLEKDQEGAKKVKQVVANGVLTSVYLQLPRKGQLYRLILFNETFNPENKITLIYIESKNDSENILKLILKKK